MFLKYLRIEKNDGKLIRHIPFKLGVNLIVDTSNISADKKESGNNVGKTTVLRLIDFCLGGDAKAIYQDPEFKTTNPTVKSFLEDNNIVITLLLGDSFDDSKNDIVLKRNFLKYRKKLSEINGDNYSNDKDYCSELNRLIFNSNIEKPTFRQLIPRYIRIDALRMDRVIKYLHSSTTGNDYEGIYFFMFGNGTELSAEKKELSANIKFNTKVISDTFNSQTSSAIEQHLSLISNDIEKIEEQKRIFNINPQYKKEFSQLQTLKERISHLSSDLSEKTFRLNLLKESIHELQQQTSNIDTEAIKTIYQEAKLYIPQLQKSFDDAINFHNQLLSNKMKFLSEDIPKLETEVEEKTKALNSALLDEEKLGAHLVKNGSLSDYELLVSESNKKYEQKGRLSEEFSKLISLEESIEKKLKRIDEINDILKESGNILKENIKKFNEFFSFYSENFYGEQFALNEYFEDNVFKFKITNVDGNLGDGKKKGVIAAFDLAYIAYTNYKQLQRPKFILHDRIEGIHGNQLKSLLDTVNSSEFNGQYLASVLSGKFSELQLSNNYLENNKILELSQSDKLFKIKEINSVGDKNLNEAEQTD